MDRNKCNTRPHDRYKMGAGVEDPKTLALSDTSLRSPGSVFYGEKDSETVELGREESCARLEMPATGTRERTFQYVASYLSFLFQKNRSLSAAIMKEGFTG